MIFSHLVEKRNNIFSKKEPGSPAPARGHPARQKRQFFLFAQCGLLPFSGRPSLLPRVSLRKWSRMAKGRLIPAGFVFAGAPLAGATSKQVRTANPRGDDPFFFIVATAYLWYKENPF